MTEKDAQENPNSPAGWAVEEAVNPDAHPGGELLAIEEQKRRDTAALEDQHNRSPMDNENPAQPGGFAVPPATNAPVPGQGADALRSASAEVDIVARVFASKTATKLEGAKVVLGTSQEDVQIGEVVADTPDWFGVQWRDNDEPTWENKTNYELIQRDEA